MSIRAEVLLSSLGLSVLLIGGHLYTWRLQVLRPRRDYSEIQTRLRSWWVMLGVLEGALILGYLPSIFFFGAISLIAFREYVSLVPFRSEDRPLLVWAYLAIPFQYWFVARGFQSAAQLFIPVFTILFLPLQMVVSGTTRGFLNAAGVLQWGLMITVYSVSHIAALLNVPTQGVLPYNVGLVLFFVLTVQFNDVAQFCWGKAIGTTKILPLVSPGKTVEGFVGGLFTTAIGAALLGPLVSPFRGLECLIIGFCLAALGFVGDVVISALKRDLKVKDFSNLIPGHGGILDRIDSLLCSAPLFFYFVNSIHQK